MMCPEEQFAVRCPEARLYRSLFVGFCVYSWFGAIGADTRETLQILTSALRNNNNNNCWHMRRGRLCCPQVVRSGQVADSHWLLCFQEKTEPLSREETQPQELQSRAETQPRETAKSKQRAALQPREGGQVQRPPEAVSNSSHAHPVCPPTPQRQ